MDVRVDRTAAADRGATQSNRAPPSRGIAAGLPFPAQPAALAHIQVKPPRLLQLSYLHGAVLHHLVRRIHRE